MAGEKEKRRRVGPLLWVVIVAFAVVGAWVTFTNAFEWAKPWWRYGTVASIAFTLGTLYGRFRRDERAKSSRT